jgi:phosphopantothenoylcysteine decarboxylase/phosphopantothenate--cysteine ligase
MRPFENRRILLGVTGGIASYKSAWLARLLAQAGAQVDVVLTRSASQFIGAVTFEALTGRPVHTELIAAGHALDHIRLARAADLVIVAPATADFLARAVHGHADELLSACLLAATAPVMLVPAMNDHMWSHPAVRRNTQLAGELGYHVIEPDSGPLAVGEGSGPGRMPEPESIMAHAARLLTPRGALHGKRVLVTAGPTREPIDPVRYIGNRSSGKMGVAIAEAAWRRGANVTLIAGPMSVSPPLGVEVQQVETTTDMANAVWSRLADADVLVMAAAPADFGVAAPSWMKMKKKAGAPPPLELEARPDILVGARDRRKPGSVVVGFALETNDVLQNGRAKLAAKGLDLIVVNDATEAGAGFGVDTNRVTLIDARGEEALPLLSKADVAEAILDRVEGLSSGR